MKRVGRLIGVLSQTPFMSALCLWLLLWMTWGWARESEDGIGSWLSEQIGLVVPSNSSVARMQQGEIGVAQRFIVEDQGAASLLDGEHAAHHPRVLATLYVRKAESKYGMFAVTRAVDGVSATVTTFEPTLSVRQRREHVVKLCDGNEELKPYRGAFVPGGAPVKIQRVVASGYVVNAIAAGLVLVGLRSMVWAWRGVRLPWGRNAAWQRAAEAQGGVWGRVFTSSPWTTLLCGACVWVMVMINLKPLTMWMMRYRHDTLLQTYPGFNSSPMMQMWYGVGAASRPSSAADFRASIQSSLRTLNIRVALLEERGTWLAPMWTADEPILVFTNPPDTQSRRAKAEQVVVPILFGTPPAGGGLWDAPQPRRMLVDGVYYNVIMLAFGMITVYSVRWTWEGLVWPWQWKRLRQGVCVKCGYSLAGISGVQCPECGNARNNLNAIQASQQ